MSKIRNVLALVLVFIFVAILIALTGVSLISSSIVKGNLDANVDLPILLTPDTMGESKSTGAIRINSAGEAELQGFPVGVVETGGEGKCLVWDGKATFTGSAEWSIDGESMITVTTKSGDSVIGPYHPPFSDVVWYKFGIPLCGEGDVMWYWVAT